jgi:exodeoxyribonuclease VII large subunit
VIRDFLNIVNRRHSGLNVLLCPVSVQGENAAAEVEAAIATLNTPGLVDVIVIARGGGSLEDLAAFNSERVARAIVNSGLPVVSAIGHETDFTIADFVADLRAPTPSAAAELITAAQYRIAEYLSAQVHRLERAARFQLLQARQRVARVPVSRTEGRMSTLLHRRQQQLDDLSSRMEEAIYEPLRADQRHIAQLTATVLRHDPRQALGRARERLTAAYTHLHRSMERKFHESRADLTALGARLQSLSPMAVLERGYALVLDRNGAPIRSVAQVAPGDTITTRVADGAFTSRIQPAARNKSAKS